MEVKKKIVLAQSQIKICEMLATAGLDEDQAKVEAEGIPFDYEAEKAKREHEFIMFYANEMRRMRDWEETRDKGFHRVISALIGCDRLYNYVREHVPDLKALRELDPAEVLKVHGYGKKTVEELKTLQERFTKHRNILPRLNKAIQTERHLQKFTEEHSDTIRTYKALQRNAKHSKSFLDQTWKYHVG
jgi:DNA-directed RNA polymerase alpha subunit